MNTATKLSGFALGLVAVFGAAYGIGNLAGRSRRPGRRDPTRRQRQRPRGR
ncbi:hypothetical protein V2I01_17275 [Micromonospora sp. BRA006-A]|nr:hypothetical protein [Micromonospora sp. BRA006-A]